MLIELRLGLPSLQVLATGITQLENLGLDSRQEDQILDLQPGNPGLDSQLGNPGLDLRQEDQTLDLQPGNPGLDSRQEDLKQDTHQENHGRDSRLKDQTHRL